MTNSTLNLSDPYDGTEVFPVKPANKLNSYREKYEKDDCRFEVAGNGDYNKISPPVLF